jgi:hypothetical protein
VLGELISQRIDPTLFITGDKAKIWEQMKAEEERVSKMRKEQQTRKLMQNSDIKMTIYPAFDKFFEQQQHENK